MSCPKHIYVSTANCSREVRKHTSKLVNPNTISSTHSFLPIASGIISQLRSSNPSPSHSSVLTVLNNKPSLVKSSVALTILSRSTFLISSNPLSPLFSIPNLRRNISYTTSASSLVPGAVPGPNTPDMRIARRNKRPEAGAGNSICAQMDMAPPDSPKSVTLSLAPPKPSTKRWIH